MKVGLAQGTPRFVGALWLVPLIVRRPMARAFALALAAGTTWFFRDPERTPDGDGLLAASDGVVQWVRSDERQTTVSTYLNLFDVHVTRAPCDATVVEQTYTLGRHLRASSSSAHTNEQLEWRLATEYWRGRAHAVRRSGRSSDRPLPQGGDVLRRGEPIGLIRFGSRVDVAVPQGLSVAARGGQRLYAGATVVAEPGLP